MRKSTVALVLGMTMTASSLVTGAAVSAEEKTKLVIAYRDSEDKGEENYMYKWIMDSYENWEKKDQVELDLQMIVANDSDYFTRLQVEMQDPSTCPDVFFEDTFQLNTDVAAGYIADITSYTEGWEDWNTAVIDSLKEGTKGADGNTYAVPIDTDVRGLWYNRDVMEAAGLGREWQPETWQDILDACAAIKENCEEDVVPIWMSVVPSEATSMNTFEMLLYGTGETLVNEETGVWNVGGQGVKDSLDFIAACKQEGYLGTLSEVFDASNWEYANLYMSTGKLGMYLNGSWGYADYLQDRGYPMQGYTDDTLVDGLGFAQFPQQNGGGYVTMSGGWSWAIAENSENKDLGFEFITELMKPEHYITFLTGSGNMAVRNDMMDFEEYGSKLYVNEATEMSETAFFRPHNENYTKVSSYLYEMVDTIVRNDTDVETAMADYKTNVETVVGADFVQ